MFDIDVLYVSFEMFGPNTNKFYFFKLLFNTIGWTWVHVLPK